jgi:hypothetical protein
LSSALATQRADTNHAADSQLANISTRGFVQADDNVMIGGFDPTLKLHDGNGALLISNDD